MARKKADQARGAAESGEERSAVLTDDRSEDASATSVVDTDAAASRDDDVVRARDDEDALDEDARDEDTVREHAAEDDADERDGDTAVVTTDPEPVEDEADHDVADDDLDEDDDLDDLDDEDEGRGGPGRPAFLVTLGVAVVAVLGVLFLLGAFVWPAFLGPGAPDETANRAVSALAAKDPAQLDPISCVRRDGQPAASFPPELLSLIGSAAPAGPPVQTLDTEARAPIDLTLTQGGQSQTLPADLLLGVSGGDWCLNGISQRQ